MARATTYYEELDLPITATTSEIKRRYRSLAIVTHPDAPGGSESRFLRLKEAYECLVSPTARRAYDEHLKRPIEQPVASPNYTTSNDHAATMSSEPRRRSYYGRFAILMLVVIVGLTGRAFYLLSKPTPAVPVPRTVQQSTTASQGVTNVNPSTDNTSISNSNEDTDPGTATGSDTFSNNSQPFGGRIMRGQQLPTANPAS